MNYRKQKLILLMTIKIILKEIMKKIRTKENDYLRTRETVRKWMEVLNILAFLIVNKPKINKLYVKFFFFIKMV